MKINRRKAIQLALLGGGCLLLPIAIQKLVSQSSKRLIGRFDLPFRTLPLLNPVRSDESTDYYEIVIEKSQAEIIPGFQTEIWGYNGIAPGPLIRQQQGRRSQVRFINKLGKDSQKQNIDTVIHLHGMPSQPQYDGYGMDFVPPNYYKDYEYPNDRVATLWYHDHVMDLTWRNVYMGLLGMYIVEDEYERNLPLPKGDYDVPLVIESKEFATDGSLIFNDDDKESLFESNVTLINGVPWARMEVANRKYRFRILNGTAKTFYQLALSRNQSSLSEGEQLIVIGNDGGLIDKPVIVNAPETLRMSMAERYEVVIDFSKYPIGTRLYLQNTGLEETVDFSTPVKPLMCFDVVRQEPDDSEVPSQLRPFETIPISAVVRERTFTYEREKGKWAINHKVWDVNRIDAQVNPGDIEIWTFVNPQEGKLHPVHLHIVEGQILDRNGKPPFPYERGWKDVFHLGSQETLRVVLKFATRDGRKLEGKYMMHCHHLQHEDNGMMSQFVVGHDGIDPVTTAPAKPITEI
ncbi:multicopper oxidase family protein [Candidatus Gracilibacteria bacterium]|nr:multicopper oxidase family protein [Candidatus Gracilibacteria bacterium]NJM87856.1 multicopper oxidase family protein [Hydrococcus sp. RU_2_2]NJP18767.1 multicopper oxidase family protein [Hydrococcus sp. CRU_1_1]